MSEDWYERAACRDMAPRKAGDPDAFFDFDDEGTGDGVAWEARARCVPCPVRRDCLASAFLTEHSTRHGVYGGTLPAQRLAVRQAPDRLDRLTAAVDAYGQRMKPLHAVLRRGVA